MKRRRVAATPASKKEVNPSKNLKVILEEFTSFIAVADLHFTANEADEYRWSIFPWLATKVEETGASDIILCGDITDRKDNHPSELTNRLTDELVKLSDKCRVHFLMGNHDMIKEDTPYFEFIKHIPNVMYHKEPAQLGSCALLPYTKTPELDWLDYDFSDIEHVFMHQPCIGAKSSDFYELEHGTSPTLFSSKTNLKGRVWSGDIHIAQTIGDVTYIGAPYPIKSGDPLNEHSALFFDRAKDGWYVEPLVFQTLVKWSIEIDSVDDLEHFRHKVNLRPYKDTFKITVEYTDENVTEWNSIKKTVKAIIEEDFKCTLLSLSLKKPRATLKSLEKSQEFSLLNKNNVDILSTYVERENIDKDLFEVGVALINNQPV